MSAERRVHQRVPYEVLVTLTSADNFWTGFTQDISAGGLFIATADPAPVGTEIEVQLTLGPGFRDVPLRGVVRWARVATGDPTIPPGVGVEFVGLQPAQLEAIRGFMRARGDTLFFEASDAI